MSIMLKKEEKPNIHFGCRNVSYANKSFILSLERILLNISTNLQVLFVRYNQIIPAGQIQGLRNSRVKLSYAFMGNIYTG